MDAGDTDSTTGRTPASASREESVDIEHVPVNNDPRAWSLFRKNFTLSLVSSAAMIAGLAGSIQNPAVIQMEKELPATSSQFSLSLSVFILCQGLMPLVWASISEVKGRKFVYLVSLSLFTVGSIVVAVSKHVGLVIGFRALQAAGSSAVITIGAATLADIFEPAERGTKMGIYYTAPTLGPALGPIFGGALTIGFNWRAIFWFLAIVSGATCLSFLLFFNDTFRQERSLTYQNILNQRPKETRNQSLLEPLARDVEALIHSPKTNIESASTKKQTSEGSAANDVIQAPVPVIRLSWKEINPFKPMALVLRRRNNVVILFASGLLFAFSYLITYTCARTLGSRYNYSSLKIGLVLLSFGIGSIGGSVLGGRFSDHELARRTAANGGKTFAELRLKSNIYTVFLFPPFILGFGWVCARHVHVSAICVMLFFCGFFSIWIYASTLAYIVDANTGRSSTAVAMNSAFRGVSAFTAVEIAVPMQDKLGDGWTYTIWTGLMLLSGLLIILDAWKGNAWRQQAEAREALERGSMSFTSDKRDITKP